MTNLISDICHIFCCPPRPSHIVAKFAFLPPPPTYNFVQVGNSNQYKINFKTEAGFISEDAKHRMEPFYTMSSRNNQIACLYINYDPFMHLRSGRGIASYGTDVPDLSTRFTILFSHGNAVDIGQMAAFLQSLAQRFQVNIMVYDYSGYGASSGQTLEDNLYADAEAALSELNNRYLCPNERVILYGQSIGTAPTVELAKNHKVAGVILHSALMSGFRVVCPGTTRRFCLDPFNNIAKVESIKSPTLIMHGTDDEVIGIHHGRELYAHLTFPLEPLWVEGAGHNDIELFHEYVERLDKFFKEDLISPTNRGRSHSSSNHIPPIGTNGRSSDLPDNHDSGKVSHENDINVNSAVSPDTSLAAHATTSKVKPLSEVFHMSLKTKKKTPTQQLSHEVLIANTNSNSNLSSVSLPTTTGEEQLLWKKNLET